MPRHSFKLWSGMLVAGLRTNREDVGLFLHTLASRLRSFGHFATTEPPLSYILLLVDNEYGERCCQSRCWKRSAGDHSFICSRRVHKRSYTGDVGREAYFQRIMYVRRIAMLTVSDPPKAVSSIFDFLITYRSFTTPDNLIELLRNRYPFLYCYPPHICLNRTYIQRDWNR